MAKVMKSIALCTSLLSLLLAFLYLHFRAALSYSLAISCGTIAYHFCMRLLVGYLLLKVPEGWLSRKRKCFQPLPFEEALYKRLRVSSWKDKMPSYAPENFSLQKHSLEELTREMCRAELVHLCIIPLSFLPLLAALEFGSFWVFASTSLLSAGFDLLFVILQRYNRPRLLRILQKKQARSA